MVMLNEKQKLAPDREQRKFGFDNNYEYRLMGYFSGERVYEPASNAIYPEFVLKGYELISTNPPPIFKLIIALMKPFMLNSKEGAEVSLYLATSPEVAQVSGQYFVKCKNAESNPLSRDPKVADEIWRWTGKMIGATLA